MGSAVTDAAGKFRIYYTSADFHKTFLSPIINVEVPFPPFDSGPDVYFRIEATDGTVLLAEGRADGHKPGRNNVGHCMCVQLCVKLPVPPGEQEPVPTVWTNVGTAFTIPAGGMLNDFTVDGYAGGAQYALTGQVRLLGSAPRKQNGHPIEYRFLVSHTTADNTAPPLGAGKLH